MDIEGEAEDGLLGQITSIAGDTLNKVTAFLSGLIEALAVMIVTACVIPVLVFVFLVWLVKTIFAANVLSLDSASLEALTGRRD
jgi:hypothetical protein